MCHVHDSLKLCDVQDRICAPVTKDLWTRSPYCVFRMLEKIFTTSNLLLHICDFSVRMQNLQSNVLKTFATIIPSYAGYRPAPSHMITDVLLTLVASNSGHVPHRRTYSRSHSRSRSYTRRSRWTIELLQAFTQSSALLYCSDELVAPLQHGHLSI